MTTIYVVYRKHEGIDSLFSSRENAQKYIDKLEEWEKQGLTIEPEILDSELEEDEDG